MGGGSGKTVSIDFTFSLYISRYGKLLAKDVVIEKFGIFGYQDGSMSIPTRVLKQLKVEPMPTNDELSFIVNTYGRGNSVDVSVNDQLLTPWRSVIGKGYTGVDWKSWFPLKIEREVYIYTVGYIKCCATIIPNMTTFPAMWSDLFDRVPPKERKWTTSCK